MMFLWEPAIAQQPPPAARRDTVLPRADYRDIPELLVHLPAVAPRPFDESLALWLGALPLSCLDRLQPRPGGRGGGRANASPPTDSARGRGPTAADSTSSTPPTARGAAPAGANNGAGYFWVAGYTLMNDHDRLRAFWGCNDWHSAVSSTWATLKVLQGYPNTTLRDLTREKLNAHLGRANLDGELSFFRATAEAINPIPSSNQTGLFERPYGFAWLLELSSDAPHVARHSGQALVGEHCAARDMDGRQPRRVFHETGRADSHRGSGQHGAQHDARARLCRHRA